MNMKKGNFYFLSKKLHDKYRSITNVLYDKEEDALSEHRRPHMLIRTDSLNIHWFIPVTSNIYRARKIYEEQCSRYGHCIMMHIGDVHGMTMGFVLSGIVPATITYVDKVYMWNNVPLQADSVNLLDVERKFLHILEYCCTRCTGNDRNHAVAMYNVMLNEVQKAG